MKPGDKVRRTGEDKNGVKKGKVYTIVSVNLDLIYLKEVSQEYCYDRKKFQVVKALPEWF